ncbi:MAG: Uma2 family endonuclease [Anaerolineaceae bacterium]|nr:Uma2 family endonuclease [Anaerolineaceae bacterium]
MTAEEFDTLVERFPGSGTYELLDGVFSEKIPPDLVTVELVGFLYACIWLHLRRSGSDGNVSSSYHGYEMGGEHLVPSLVYHAPGRPFNFYSDQLDPPDLAVEVVSDESNRTELDDLRAKLRHYRAAGVTVWVVLPRAQRAEVHEPDADPAQGPVTLGPDDALQAPQLLPGFSLPLREIFSQ